jgi:hypothetical protein
LPFGCWVNLVIHRWALHAAGLTLFEGILSIHWR